MTMSVGGSFRQGQPGDFGALAICRDVRWLKIFLVLQAIDLWISYKILIIGQRRAIRIIRHHLTGTYLVGRRAATKSDSGARHGLTRTQGST